MGDTEILCSFKLVQEVKLGREIPESSRLEFLEKFSVNNCALLDAEDNSSRPLNRAGIVDLPFLRTVLSIRQKSREPSFWEGMDSFVLLAYASLTASRTRSQQLLACLNFFWKEKFIRLVQTKKVISITTAAQAAENHGDERGLI